MNQKKTGVLAILGASLMWAFEPIFAKLAYRNSDFVQTSAIRAVFVALVAAFYIMLRRRRPAKVTGRQFSQLVYVALAGTMFGDLVYFYALTRVPVLNAVLLAHMQPIFIVLIGFFCLKEERLTKSDFAGIAVMIMAGVLVTTRTLENLSAVRLGTAGDVYVLLATGAWATTTIVVRKYLRDLDAGSITFYRYMVASAVFMAYLSLRSSLAFPNIYQVLVGVVVGAGTIFYYEGLTRIKAAQVCALELATPFFGALLGFFILSERVTAMQMTGVAVLFAGVYLLSKKEDSSL
ncbi:MAG: DMT family transporter [Planctomycetota bacterium]|jgi:drug/metabolite transporter (DMT)-like permease